MLGNRRRRWFNNKPAVGQHLVFAGYLVPNQHILRMMFTWFSGRVAYRKCVALSLCHSLSPVSIMVRAVNYN